MMLLYSFTFIIAASGVVRASFDPDTNLVDNDESSEIPWPQNNFLSEQDIRDTGEKRSAFRATMARRSQKTKEEQFIPSISVGAYDELCK